jgi:3-dehydroquinate synthetase
MQRLLAGIGVDKKRKAGKLRLVLPRRIGEVRWGVEIDDPAELLFNALRH